jgi:hypothetical protein
MALEPEQPGVSVSAVARKYGIVAGLLIRRRVQYGLTQMKRVKHAPVSLSDGTPTACPLQDLAQPLTMTAIDLADGRRVFAQCRFEPLRHRTAESNAGHRASSRATAHNILDRLANRRRQTLSGGPLSDPQQHACSRLAKRALNVVPDVDKLALERLRLAQQCAHLLHLEVLHMDGAKPPPPHHLRNSTRIVSAGFFEHYRQRPAQVLSFHDYNRRSDCVEFAHS